MKRFILYTLLCLFLPLTGMTAGLLADKNDPTPNAGTLITYEDVQSSRPADETPCATKIFADALAQSAHTVQESDDEQIIEQWIAVMFADKDVLSRVLECPEVKNINETDTIKFLPIMYKFPYGREIIINYETQPKIFKQRLLIATKRNLPLSDPNPKINNGDDNWINTDPAWYGIIVTEHGALKNFVGPEKNNTISMQYIYDNIDDLYPEGYHCTSRSAWANDDDSINESVTKTVGIGEDDSNDYYVAGDADLTWVMWAEVALDVFLTIVTFGASTAVSGTTKAARASRSLKGMLKPIRSMRSLDRNADYVKASKQAAEITNQLNKLDAAKDAAKIADLKKTLTKAQDTMKAIETSTENVRKWASTSREIEKKTAEIKKLHKTKDKTKIAELNKEIETLKKTTKSLEELDEVKEYKKYSAELRKLSKYRNSLHLLRGAKRGNVAVRMARAIKSANSGNRLLRRAARMGRSSSIAGRARDWLFSATLRSVSAVARSTAKAGFLYTSLKFLGDMYDKTQTSTGDYTNDIDFSPFLLLSADDIDGQENEINYGMWLMWSGDSYSAADDDAAYLQAMDFASKVHEDLVEHQNGTNDPCNVDIYVVRPIIRNPGTENAAIYYLVMNDIPWSTAE